MNKEIEQIISSHEAAIEQGWVDITESDFFWDDFVKLVEYAKEMYNAQQQQDAPMSHLKTVRDALENKFEEVEIDDVTHMAIPIEEYHELIETIDRMIETPAPQGWNTIESAPKDGTEILLALWSGHPEHKTSFCWAINGHYKDGFFYSKDPMIGKLASPTHWQHITAPTPAPTEKVYLEALKYEVRGADLGDKGECYSDDVIDYLANTGRLR